LPVWCWCAVQEYSKFLNIGAGARGLGMGEHRWPVPKMGVLVTGTRGLVMYTSIRVSFMHADYFAGIAKYITQCAIPRNDKYKTLGISLLRFGVDDIPNTLYWWTRWFY
jgi:hypothetical protein